MFLIIKNKLYGAIYMSEYTIKQYQKGFEENQEKIGVEVAKSFIIPHQTTAARLKDRY